MKNVFSKVLAIVILLIIIIAIGFIPVKPKREVGQDLTPIIETAKPLSKGFSITPKGFEGNDFLDFFEKVRVTKSLVLWAGDVTDLANSQSTPYVLMSLSKTYGFTPVIVTAPVDKKLILDFVSKVKPPYLGIGNEINREKSTYIQKLAKDFNEIYPEIKGVSPDTKVFPVFQLEIMKGLQGGLLGRVNNPEDTDWQLLELFPKADLIGLTTYPALIYKSPSEIPNDYYTLLKAYTEKPIIFTEVGWPSKIDVPEWETSETEQAGFIRIFKEKIKELKPEFAIWTFMYDQTIQKPFDTMGLITREGKEKEGWKVWTEK